MNKICTICNTEFFDTGKRKYCPTCKDASDHVNQERSMMKLKLQQAERKQRVVDYAGGKCIKCGYNRCLAALAFHHRDPANKIGSISKLLRPKKVDWALVFAEVDKCDLLCMNCHHEEHYC